MQAGSGDKAQDEGTFMVRLRPSPFKFSLHTSAAASFGNDTFSRPRARPGEHFAARSFRFFQ
jgi:hypothetical protein